MSRGHASVQLKTVRQRQTPFLVFRTASRSSAASSRLSKMKRCALTIAAGPTNSLFVQNGGHDVVHAAHRMHLVPSSYFARSAGLCSRSASCGAAESLTRYGTTERDFSKNG